MKIFFTQIILFLYASVASLYAQNINKYNILGPAGIRVNSFSGSLFYQRNDLYIPGRGPSTDLTFSYNSAATSLDLGYGPGWTMTYSMICKPHGNEVIVRHGDGRKDVYKVSAGNLYHPPAGIFDSLVQYQPGKFKLFSTTGLVYFFENAVHHRLTKVADMNDNSILIGYTDSLATSITDASGRIVSLTYSNGHLIQVNDANVIPPRIITYQYSPANDLISVTDPTGYSIQYGYDVLHNMDEIRDQQSNQFFILYQNCQNVEKIISPLNSIGISYDAALLTTTVTELVNSVQQNTVFKYNSSGDLVEKTGGCCDFHETYAYDPMHNLIQRTDANGNQYNYAYDAKGNLLMETDPLGNTLTCIRVDGYANNPVYSTITGITDKNGNTTNFTYDPNANLLQINSPLGITRSFAYDLNGNMISFTDGNGNLTQYQYNVHGDKTMITFPDGSIQLYSYDNVSNQKSHTDENGNVTFYNYDPLNRLTQITGALGNTTSYNYDARGNMTSISDALGHTVTYTYDALNRVLTATSPSGTASLSYNEAGNILSATDALGNTTSYTYNVNNQLTAETDAAGFSSSYSYDGNGNLVSYRNKRGFITSYSYDAVNQLTQLTDAMGNITTHVYDPNGNRISTTDANAHTTSYVYDALDRLIEIHRPIGTITYGYDAGGNQISRSDALGNSTTITFNNRNRQIASMDALGHSTVYTYDSHGNLLSLTDRNGHTSTYTYDALNRRVTHSNPPGETYTTAYDAVGKIISSTTPWGNVITYSYDAADRLTSATDLSGTIATYSYDANSNLISESDGNGNTTTYAYDALNRKISFTDPGGFNGSNAYDPQGNVISTTDRNLHTTNFSFDPLDRLVSTTLPSGDQTAIAYDAMGNTISITDDNGNSTAYTYDNNDRLIVETMADGTSNNYSYDLSGNVITRIDNNGNTTQYAYDALDRMITINYPGMNDNSYSYDNEGSLISATNNNAVVNYTYDNAGRLTSESLNGRTSSFIYDTPNHKRNVIYPGGRSIAESYDYRTRLTSVKESGIDLAAFTYDPADRLLTRTLKNGILSEYSYSSNDWLTKLRHSSGAIVADFNYEIDNEGNRKYELKAHHTNNSQQFGYDSNDRLTNLKEGVLLGSNIPLPHTQTQFNYDGAGNRTSVVKNLSITSYTSDAVNKYTAINMGPVINPTYDANGNAVSDGSHTYTYDFENRILSVDGGLTASYKYDALGRRIQKNTPSGTTNYFFEGERVIEECDALNVVKATYVYGNWLDDIVSMQRAGLDYYYSSNANGSVAAVTDNSGNIAEQYEYDAYGKPAFYNSSFTLIPGSVIGNNYLYEGKEYDTETGMYNNRARSYKPEWGRFVQRDPYGNWSDIYNIGNHYSYVGNNPVNWFDPTGLIVVTGGKNGTKVTTPDGATIILKSGETADVPTGSKFEDLPGEKKEPETPRPKPTPPPVPPGATRPPVKKGDEQPSKPPTSPQLPKVNGGSSVRPPAGSYPEPKGNEPQKEPAQPGCPPSAGQLGKEVKKGVGGIIGGNHPGGPGGVLGKLAEKAREGKSSGTPSTDGGKSPDKEKKDPAPAPAGPDLGPLYGQYILWLLRGRVGPNPIDEFIKAMKKQAELDKQREEDRKAKERLMPPIEPGFER